MANTTKVTRISAKDDAPKKAQKPTKAAEAKNAKAVKKQVKPVKKSDGKKNVFARIGGYFKGAWYELRQVRWPNRKATWGLTLAVILFSLFFTVLIVLLDILFKYIFELIIA